MARHNALSHTTGFLTGLAWRVILAAAALYMVMASIRYAYSFGHGLLYEHAVDQEPGREVEIRLTEGDDRRDIAKQLLEDGLINNENAFVLQAFLYKTDFEPGTYTLNTAMTIEEMLSYLEEEGSKQRELREKNLVSDQTTEAAGATEEDTAEIIGGNEDVIDDTTAAAGTGDTAAQASSSAEAAGNKPESSASP